MTKINFNMAGCNRNESMMTETVEAIGHDGKKKFEVKFVLRTLTDYENRMIQQLRPRPVYREHKRVKADGEYLRDNTGKIIIDTEGYTEKGDPNAPGILEAQVILGMGGDLRNICKTNKDANERLCVGWYIDGVKQDFSHDVWDGFAFPDELKGELMLAAQRANSIGDYLSKK